MSDFHNKYEANLEEHIRVLSHPLFEGRLAGMSGAAKAADYLATQLFNIGALPLGANRYLQPLDVPATRITGPVTLKIGNWRLRHRIDFGEMRLSSGGAYSGKLLVMRDGEDIEESLESKIILIPQRPQDFDLESTVKAGIEMASRVCFSKKASHAGFTRLLLCLQTLVSR